MFHLNSTQQLLLAEWMQSNEVQSVIRGKRWQIALVCDSSSGVGVTQVATIRNEDGDVVTKDLTDFDTW